MKKIISSLALIFIGGMAFSQSFMQGAGVQFLLTTADQSNEVAVGSGFTYSPRFNFLEAEKYSVSVGVPLFVGFTVGTSIYNDVVGVTLQAPIMLNLNMGRGSTKDNRDKFGYFVGAGPALLYTSYIDDYYYTNNGSYSTSTNVFGIAANAGVRLGVGRKYRNIEIRLSYMKGLNDIKPNAFGVGCSFNF